MHGYYWNGLCSTGTGLLGNGWVVFTMGLGLLIVVGVVLWLLYGQRAAHPAGGGFAHTSYSAPVSSDDSAERIVRERFARGEIDRDEYDRVIAALRTK